jgi:MFS family permease
VNALRRGTAETFASLHVRNFRLFFTGQIISQVGNWLTLVAQSLLILELTNNGFAVGLLVAAQFAPVLILGPWAGLVADRSDKRKLLIAVQSVAMAQSFALAALAFIGHPPIWLFYAVASVGGLTMAFDNPTRRSFVVEMVPEEQVNNAVGLNSALMTSARVFGPALAGLLITTMGYGWAFLADALSYIAVLIALYMMRTDELRPSPQTPKAKGQVRAGMRYVRSQRDLFVPLMMMTIVGTLAFNFSVVFPVFVKFTLHHGTTAFTLLFSVVSVGSVAGALVAARRKVVEIRSVAVASLVFGAAMTAMSFVPNLAWAFPVGLFVGFGSISFLTTSTAIVQIKAKPEMRGRVLALQAMVFLGSTPIGGPIVGWVSDTWGARYAIGLGAAAALGAGLWGLWVVRRTAELHFDDRSLASDEAKRAEADIETLAHA